jgi:hypothetical protein
MPRLTRPTWLMTVVWSAFMLAASPVQARWATVGAMQPAGRSSSALTFRDARSIVSVSAVTSDIIRVRFSPTKELGRGHFVKQPGRIDRRSAAVARAR